MKQFCQEPNHVTDYSNQQQYSNLPSYIECIAPIVVDHSIAMTDTQISHGHNKYRYFHYTRLQKTHKSKADDALSHEVNYLPAKQNSTIDQTKTALRINFKISLKQNG